MRRWKRVACVSEQPRLVPLLLPRGSARVCTASCQLLQPISLCTCAASRKLMSLARGCCLTCRPRAVRCSAQRSCRAPRGVTHKSGKKAKKTKKHFFFVPNQLVFPHARRYSESRAPPPRRAPLAPPQQCHAASGLYIGSPMYAMGSKGVQFACYKNLL